MRLAQPNCKLTRWPEHEAFSRGCWLPDFGELPDGRF